MGNANESRLLYSKKENSIDDESDECDVSYNCKSSLIGFKYKIDTSKFDQYFGKSSELQKYKNLDCSMRQMIHEGVICLKQDNHLQELYGLLFDDILVLLEISLGVGKSKLKKHADVDFMLKPLISNPNTKRNAILSPIIPLKCIKSINNFTQDSSLFITVFMDDEKNIKKCRPYKTEHFFIFETKSEQETNAWKRHLEHQFRNLNKDLSMGDSAIDSASDLSSATMDDTFKSKSKTSFSSRKSSSNDSLVLLI